MANYTIIEDRPDYVLIQDIGPWDQFRTVTNDVETVVEELMPMLGKRRLFCIDSCGGTDQILHNGVKFVGFRAGKPPTMERTVNSRFFE